MNYRINAFQHFYIDYSRKQTKDKTIAMKKTEDKRWQKYQLCFTPSGRKIRVQILFSSYNPG